MKRMVNHPGLLWLLGGTRDPSRAEMVLSVPAPYARAATLETDSRALLRRLASFGPGPVELLREGNRYLDQLNRSKVDPGTRLPLVDTALSVLGPAAGMVFTRYVQQPGGLPEGDERREAMVHAIIAVERLVTNYKLILAHDWELPRRAYEQHRERVRHCALRIMELIRLEQWLRALRYKRLPKRTWQDCNELYFALRTTEPVDKIQTLKIQLNLSHNTRDELPLLSPTATLDQVYLSIQIMGLVDPTTGSPHLLSATEGYLRDISSSLPLTPHDGASLGPGHAIIYRGRQAPPGFRRLPEHTSEAMVVDLGPLRARLEKDRTSLQGAAPGGELSGALSSVPMEERLPLIEFILQQLQPRSRREARHHIYGAQHASVYFGFPESFRLLRDLAKTSVTQERAFRDALAKHSSTLVEDEDQGRDGRWMVVDISAGGVQLGIQEGRYTVPVHVGQLVTYQLLSAAASAPQLGYVVRLHRAGEKDIEVGIAALAGHADSVAVQDPNAGTPEALIPAILVRDAEIGPRIVFAAGHGLKPGAPVTMHFERQPHNAKLGKTVLRRAGFTVFELLQA